MKAEIKGGASFSYLDIDLEPSETLIAESDAMSSMHTDIDLKAEFNGGFIQGILRKYLGGESLFVSRFTNNADTNRRLTLVQPTPGEIRSISLNGNSYFLQPGAFLACSGDITLGLSWAGFVSFIAREGLFRLKVSGTGTVWYGAYGALLERDVDGELIVDTSHLVAYEPGINLKMQLAGGLFSSILGGEGLVTRVEGQGKIIIQTRSLSGVTAWLNPKFR